MKPIKGLSLALITLGIVGLAYGGFTYTRETHTAQLGPLEMTVKDQRRVNVPIWAGVGALLIGATLLLVPIGKRA